MCLLHQYRNFRIYVLIGALKATKGFLKCDGLYMENQTQSRSNIKCILCTLWQDDVEVVKDDNILLLQCSFHQTLNCLSHR